MEIYKGDIFYITRPQQYQSQGSEQKPDRPAIVVSNNANNTHSSVIEVVYLTTQEKKPLPTHVEVMCHVPSTALCEQVNSVSIERVGNYIRSCTDEEMEQIDAALLVSLGIEAQGNIVMENALKLTCEKIKAELDEKDALCEAQLKVIEELKQSDKVVVVPDNTETTKQLEFERDFYKQQYEGLFERMVGKAVQQ